MPASPYQIPGPLELIEAALRAEPQPGQEAQLAMVAQMGTWTGELAQHDVRVLGLLDAANQELAAVNEYSARLDDAANLRLEITLDEDLTALGVVVPPLNPIAGETGRLPTPPGPYPPEPPAATLPTTVYNGFKFVSDYIVWLLEQLVP